jgi:hypothetical protein
MAPDVTAPTICASLYGLPSSNISIVTAFLVRASTSFLNWARL